MYTRAASELPEGEHVIRVSDFEDLIAEMKSQSYTNGKMKLVIDVDDIDEIIRTELGL